MVLITNNIFNIVSIIKLYNRIIIIHFYKVLINNFEKKIWGVTQVANVAILDHQYFLICCSMLDDKHNGSS